MKKIMCFILAGVMVLALCACGSTKSTSEQAAETTDAVTVSPNIISTQVTANSTETAASTETADSTQIAAATEYAADANPVVSEPTTVTAAMDNAVASAITYLSGSCFSREGLIEWLENDSYTKEEATYAADHCGADWNEQAVEAASAYNSCMNVSEQEMISLLKNIGFTDAEAEYGASVVFAGV